MCPRFRGVGLLALACRLSREERDAEEISTRVPPQGSRSVEGRTIGRRGRTRSRGEHADDLQLGRPRDDRLWAEARSDEQRSSGAGRGEEAHRRTRSRARGDEAGCGVVEGGGLPKRRFEAIAVMSSDGFSNQVACRVLDVSESGFYAWRDRPPSTRSIRHLWLTDIIADVHAASRGTYGARRVHAELTLGRGLTVGDNAVEMLMRRAGLKGVPVAGALVPSTRRRPRVISSTGTSLAAN